MCLFNFKSCNSKHIIFFKKLYHKRACMCKSHSTAKGSHTISLKLHMIIKLKTVKDIHERTVKLNFLNNAKRVNIMNIFNTN